MTLTTSNYDPITKTELIKELKKIENTLKEILGAIKLQGKSV